MVHCVHQEHYLQACISTQHAVSAWLQSGHHRREERENKGRAERECKENKPGSKVQLKAVKLQLSRAGDVVSAKNYKNK